MTREHLIGTAQPPLRPPLPSASVRPPLGGAVRGWRARSPVRCWLASHVEAGISALRSSCRPKHYSPGCCSPPSP
eukprot:7285225-Prymnesium_polylepis.2